MIASEESGPRAQVAVASLVALLAAASAFTYSRYFTGSVWLLALAGAAVLASAEALIAERRGWSRLHLAAVSVVTLLLYILFTLYPASTYFGVPVPASGGALFHGLQHGFADLPAIGIPAAISARLLAPLEGITWVASLTGTVLAFRRRGALGPLLPPFLAFAAGLILTASAPGTASFATVVFVAASGVLVAVRNHSQRAAGRSRSASSRGAFGLGDTANRIALGLPVVVLMTTAALATIAVVPAASPSGRFDPRSWLDRVPSVVSGVNPLSEVDAQHDAKPARQLFLLQLSFLGRNRAPIDRVRLVALDHYDGSLWTTSGTFAPAGTDLPALPGVDRAAAADLVEKVELTGMSGPFLPTVGRPVKTSAQTLEFDTATGDLLTAASTAGGYSYTNVAAVSQPTFARLGDQKVDGAGRSFLTALPQGVPSQIASLAKRLTAGQTTPAEQVRSLVNYLRDNYAYDPDAPPGSSLASIEHFLFVSKEGQPEQFAAAFVVLARVAGLPARVAVGYLLDQRDSGGAGQYQVTTADAYAWPEVDFARYGWVAFDPMNPQDVVRSPTAPADVTVREPVKSLTDRSTQLVSRGGVGRAAAGPSARPVRHEHGSAVGIVGWLGVALVVTLVAGLGGVLAAKALRRRRRVRAASPTERVYGAWSEICDRLIEQGASIQDSLTPDEVATRASGRVGAAASATIAAMAPIVSAATYDWAEPDDGMAQRAWALEAEARALIRRDASRSSRWLAPFDPRPLRLGHRDRAIRDREPVST